MFLRIVLVKCWLLFVFGFFVVFFWRFFVVMHIVFYVFLDFEARRVPSLVICVLCF